MKKTRLLVYLAFLVALSAVLSRVMSFRLSIGGIEGIRIGLGNLPIILASFAFGPIYGGIVGAFTDVVGYLLSPMGGFVPQITFAYFLIGLIPGIVNRYIFKNANNFWTMLMAILVGQTLISVLLIPHILFHLFQLPIGATRIPKIFQVLIESPFYAYLIKTLLEYKPIKALNLSQLSLD